MKCPNCGADINDDLKFCEFCGSSISKDMKCEQEYLNKVGCPKCGSSNITFNREKQGEIKGKTGTEIVRSTVGLCKDCGHTWVTTDTDNQKHNNSLKWWILGWIFFFPAPIMILIWRKKNTWNIYVKVAVTIGFWILFFILGTIGDSSNSNSIATENSPIVESTHIYDNAEIVDLMNGFGTDKIGSITVTKANQSDCTEDALIDWYFNYIKKHTDCNCHFIIYNDNPQKGVYSLGSYFIQKDVVLVANTDGSYMLDNDAGSTYFSVNEDTKTLTKQITMADATVIESAKDKIDQFIPSEYKNGKTYMIDLAGKEGCLDCNLTLINEMFENNDCQSIAIDLATKIKNLNLGIGYFCISFQKDDYTLNAISNLDNLSIQDVSEITTKNF